MHRTLALLLLTVLLLPDAASAGAAFFFRGSSGGSKVTVAGFAVGGGLPLGYGASDEPYGWYEDPATLIVDVTPHTAQVFLDGRPLGTAGELVAQALPVAIGPHVVQVQASGFRTRSWEFYADGTFPVRVRAILALE